MAGRQDRVSQCSEPMHQRLHGRLSQPGSRAISFLQTQVHSQLHPWTFWSWCNTLPPSQRCPSIGTAPTSIY